MAAYYNEHDPFVAAWLRSLIQEGLIADGEVDERSITDVRADDVRRFTQCHFFAGIGGWSYALRLAGWDDDRPVWTGSCPCQPYSNAGQQKGADDARNLWPVWFPLIRECRPVVVFGEQVEAAVRHGWLDAVSADLEGEGYAIGACVLGAHSVGAPHLRQRLWFVADAADHRRQPSVPDAYAVGSYQGYPASGTGELGDSDEPRPQGRHPVERADQCTPWASGLVGEIPCRDGKHRLIEPSIHPLAHGIPGRVGRLRGYGNAIVPQVAAAFIQAYDDARRDLTA
jgi:DNA (cytosine-5)-methyltransferase 1